MELRHIPWSGVCDSSQHLNVIVLYHPQETYSSLTSEGKLGWPMLGLATESISGLKVV